MITLSICYFVNEIVNGGKYANNLNNFTQDETAVCKNFSYSTVIMALVGNANTLNFTYTESKN